MLNEHTLFSRTRPVHDGSKTLLTALILLVVSAVAWANIAIIDEQVRARGKVIVSSRSQIVQAVDGGVLARLHVREGQTVQKGDLLAELDQTRFEASSSETRLKALALLATVERLTAELNNQDLLFSDEISAEEDIEQTQRNLHERRLKQQREEEIALKKSLSLAKQELKALENLAKTGDAAQSEILNQRRQVLELEAKLSNQKNERRRDAQAQIANAQAELEQTRFVLKGRDEALNATKIVAPMTGLVKDIKITTIGAVLNSGEELMQIVPSDDPMLMEVRIGSADVAYLRPGLPANLKLDAYDFTVHGSMRGQVTYISPDTIDEDLKQNEEPYYRVLVSIDEIPQRSGRDPMELIPGMVSTVEIITGERTVAQYIMKPIRRGSAEAFTER